MKVSLSYQPRVYCQPQRILRISAGLILLSAVISGVLYHLVGINLIQHLPAGSLCPFRALTGISCPGCGMLRAFISIGQLKFKEAISFNSLAIPLFLVMIFYFCCGRLPLWMQAKWTGRIAVISVLIFWIARLVIS